MIEINLAALAIQAMVGLAYLALTIAASVLVATSRFSASTKLAWMLAIWLIPVVGAVTSLIVVCVHNRRALREPYPR